MNSQLTDACVRFTKRHGFTPREAEIFALFLSGFTPETASTHLGLSIHTVRNHVKNMLRATRTGSVNLLLIKFIQEAFDALAQPVP